MEGSSLAETFDDATGLSSKSVTDWKSTSKNSELKPRITLRNEKGEYVGGGMTLKTAPYVGTFLLIPVIFFLLSFGSKPLLYPWGKELSFLDILKA